MEVDGSPIGMGSARLLVEGKFTDTIHVVESTPNVGIESARTTIEAKINNIEHVAEFVPIKCSARTSI